MRAPFRKIQYLLMTHYLGPARVKGVPRFRIYPAACHVLLMSIKMVSGTISVYYTLAHHRGDGWSLAVLPGSAVYVQGQARRNTLARKFCRINTFMHLESRIVYFCENRREISLKNTRVHAAA